MKQTLRTMVPRHIAEELPEVMRRITPELWTQILDHAPKALTPTIDWVLALGDYKSVFALFVTECSRQGKDPAEVLISEKRGHNTLELQYPLLQRLVYEVQPLIESEVLAEVMKPSREPDHIRDTYVNWFTDNQRSTKKIKHLLDALRPFMIQKAVALAAFRELDGLSEYTGTRKVVTNMLRVADHWWRPLAYWDAELVEAEVRDVVTFSDAVWREMPPAVLSFSGYKHTSQEEQLEMLAYHPLGQSPVSVVLATARKRVSDAFAF